MRHLPAPVPAILFRRFTAVALILLMQGPAMLVQEIGWIGMLASYTQERGLKRGIVETFDGKHPCQFCEAAESIRRQSEEPMDPAAPQSVRPNLVWAPMMIPAGRIKLPAPASCEIAMPATKRLDHYAGRGADAPDTPPPEAV